MEINSIDIIEIAIKAGQKILEVYNSDIKSQEIESKADNSPLTLADRLANEIICESLAKLYPAIPIISEEIQLPDYEQRKNWNLFWLVDPLDGTKEFVKRNGQFTVNIALIENGVPVLGVIQVPVSGEVYFADKNGAFVLRNNTKSQLKVSNKRIDLIAVGSSSHASSGDKNVLSDYPITSHVEMGSSLKFCLIAEGKADIYYREGPTMEWDTAAGEAILVGAGGSVEGITYNKPILLNGSFLCKGF